MRTMNDSSKWEFVMTASNPAVDAYIEGLPEDRRPSMRQLRDTIRAAAPDAEEVITYKMPGFKAHGTFLVSYDAFKAHYSLFPASQEIIDALGAEVAPHVKGRGTLQFPASKPLPLDLIRRIVEIRVRENAAAAAEG
jgi:uncharacterized protein YdhG (YjbR/CyaY superfamily)